MAILDLMAAEDTTTSEEDNSSVEVGPRVVVRRGVVVRQRASPPRLKNKRKSHEPKRLAHSHTNDIDTSLLAHEMKRRRLDSTGSEVGSPPSPQLTVVGQPDRVAYSRTPSPVKCAVANDQGRHHLLSPMSAPRHQLAPKKRFKLDALRDIKEEEEVRNDASTQEDAVSCSRTESGVKSPLNPFRPWSEPSEPSEPLHQPSPAESLMSRLSSCLPFLLQAGGMVLLLGLLVLPRVPGGLEISWLAIVLIYVAAKVLEMGDQTVFHFTGWVSGHTLKHVVAGLAAWPIIHGARLYGSETH